LGDQNSNQIKKRGGHPMAFKEKTLEILKTHKPKPLPEDLVKELRKVEKGWLKRVGLEEYPKRK